MRFCTTHRACEVEHGRCVIEFHNDDTCTLVDALIIVKVDGEWPEWARSDVYSPLEYSLEQLYALALAHAAEETR